MKTATCTVDGQTITAALSGDTLVISDPEMPLIALVAERLPALLAALHAVVAEPTVPPSELIVLQLAHKADRRLHVQLAAATEMRFDMVIEPGSDYDRLITDICRVAPALMRLDGADVASGARDRQLVRGFVTTYRAQIKNAQVGLDAFAGLEGE